MTRIEAFLTSSEEYTRNMFLPALVATICLLTSLATSVIGFLTKNKVPNPQNQTSEANYIKMKTLNIMQLVIPISSVVFFLFATLLARIFNQTIPPGLFFFTAHLQSILGLLICLLTNDNCWQWSKVKLKKMWRSDVEPLNTANVNVITISEARQPDHMQLAEFSAQAQDHPA